MRSPWADHETIPSFPYRLLPTNLMTFQWLMNARSIGKRLAAIDPLPTLSRTDDENYEVICGVAGCVVKKTKLRRIPK